MNILIIGAGAIGSLVGAKLTQTGHNVTLVGRQRFVAAVANRGLLLQDETGRHQVSNIIPAASIDSIGSAIENFDFAILTVKSYDTLQAIQQLVHAYSASNLPTVICLQNGVGNEEKASSLLGPTHVIAGTITTPVSTLGPGQIRVDKPDYSMGLSQWHPAVSSVVFAAVQTALADAGFSVTIYPEAEAMKWTKLLMNMIGNATCAILDMPPDKIFADTSLANLEIEAWRETLAVMKAHRISCVNIGSYPFTFLAPLIRTMPLPLLRSALNKSVGKARGGKMPSLHIDLDSGRKESEVPWLNGAAVRKGNEVSVATPVNRMLTDVLLQLVEEPSKRDKWKRNTARLLNAASEYRAAQSGNSS